MTAPVRRAYVDGPHGQVHVRHSVPKSELHRPLLACHLTPGSGRMYEPLLARLGTDRLAMAPDTPGYGASDPPSRPPAISDYAAAMAAVLDHYRIDSIDLVGYHTGSKIAVCLALAQPDRVNRLVLVSAPNYSTEHLERQKRELGPSRRPTVEGTHLLRHWRGLLEWRGPGQTLRMLQDEFAEQQRGGPRAHWGYLAAFRYPHAQYLPQVKQRVLLLCPRDDLEQATLAAAGLLRNGELRRLPDWGHGMTWAHGDELAELLREFLDVPRDADVETTG